MNDDAEKKFFEATAIADGCIQELIRRELQREIPFAEQDVAIQAMRLKTAYEALQKAREPITDLEREITEAETEQAEWESRKTSDQIGDRVAYRGWHDHWAEEIRDLRNRLTALRQSIGPLESEHAKQAKSLAEAENKLAGLKANIMYPLAELGQQTEAYQIFRCSYGSIVRVLTMANESHWEWPRAIQWLHGLCDLLGYDLTPNTDRKTKQQNDDLMRHYQEQVDKTSGTGMTVNHADNPTSDDYRFASQLPTRYVPSRSELDVPHVPQQYKTP